MQTPDQLTLAPSAVVVVSGCRLLAGKPLRIFEDCPRLRCDASPGGRWRYADPLGGTDCVGDAIFLCGEAAGAFTHGEVVADRGNSS